MTRIGRGIFAGLVVGFLQVMIAFSLATLLFAGDFAPYLARGIGIMLAGTFVGVVVAAIFSAESEIMPAMQSSLVVILATLAATLTVSPAHDAFLTLVASLSVTAVAVGTVLFLIGQLRLVRFVYYVPYPVIGGFLAGNGWLMIDGALQTAVPVDFTWAIADVWAWLPPILIALALFIGVRLSSHVLVLPAILIASVGMIYIGLNVSGISLASAQTTGILLGDIGAVRLQTPLQTDWTRVDWGAIAAQWGRIVTVILVAVIHLLLNLTGLELMKEREFDLDAEVRANGIMNLLIGVTGGNVGFYSASVSTLLHKINAHGRIVYAVAAGLILLVTVLGATLLQWVPNAVLAGLLMFLGLEFIHRWLIVGYRQLTLSEYLVVLIIMLTVVFVGFLEGVALGILVMMIVFAGTYSQINIFYRATSANHLISTVERNPKFQKALHRHRDKIYVLELSGFLFFGTANNVIDAVRARLQDPDAPPLTYLIIDFRRVNGTDSSGVSSFRKVLILAQKYGFTVILANVNQALIRQELATTERVVFQQDLDHALEWCEDQLIEQTGITRLHAPAKLWRQLKELGMRAEDARAIVDYMNYRDFEADEIIIKQGEAADHVYFIELGKVSVYLETEDASDDIIRLRTLSYGTIIGEIGFVLGHQRSATVLADEQTRIWFIDREQLDHLQAEQPAIALAFNEMLLRIVAQRVASSNRLLGILR